MPMNRDWVGRTFPPGEPYLVTREKIREFADAIGDPDPAYRDPEAARTLGHPDVVAPPTFAIVLSYRLGSAVIFDPDLGLDYSTVVHGEQSFVHHRAVRAGDTLVGTARIADIRTAGRNELLTWEAEFATPDGEPVVRTANTLVARGTAPAEDPA
jgi:acyl dehydratase